MISEIEANIENRKLSFLNFITNFGDWISYFGFMYFFYESTKSIMTASSVITIKAGAILFANAVYPYISNHIKIKNLIYIPQLICAIVGIAIVIKVNEINNENIAVVFVLLILQSCFREIFSISRDTYSKYLRENTSHLNLQAQLMSSLFASQFLGPLFVIFTIKHLSVRQFILLDVLTFVIATVIGFYLKPFHAVFEKRNLFAPIKYIKNNFSLMIVFFLRSFAFTFTTGVSNFAGAGLVQTKFGFHIVNSAWTYLSNGLGGYVSTVLLRGKLNKITKLNLGFFAFLGFAVIGIVRILYSTVDSYYLVVAVYVLSGIGMGIHAISSQTLRSLLTDNKQFPEVCALENVFGEFVTFASQLFCSFLIVKGLVSHSEAMFFSGVVTIASSFLYFVCKEKDH